MRLALPFAVLQVIAALGALLAVPAFRAQGLGTFLLVSLGIVDLILLALFASWLLRRAGGGDTCVSGRYGRAQRR